MLAYRSGEFGLLGRQFPRDTASENSKHLRQLDGIGTRLGRCLQMPVDLFEILVEMTGTDHLCQIPLHK